MFLYIRVSDPAARSVHHGEGCVFRAGWTWAKYAIRRAERVFRDEGRAFVLQETGATVRRWMVETNRLTCRVGL